MNWMTKMHAIQQRGFMKLKGLFFNGTRSIHRCEVLFSVHGQDYYAVLKVSRKATKDEIRKAYISLVKQYHPDVNKDKNAHSTFTRISKAYETLGNDAARREYDRSIGQQSRFNSGSSRTRPYSETRDYRRQEKGPPHSQHQQRSKYRDPFNNDYHDQRYNKYHNPFFGNFHDPYRNRRREEEHWNWEAFYRETEEQERIRREELKKRRKYWDKREEELQKQFDEAMRERMRKLSEAARRMQSEWETHMNPTRSSFRGFPKSGGLGGGTKYNKNERKTNFTQREDKDEKGSFSKWLNGLDVNTMDRLFAAYIVLVCIALFNIYNSGSNVQEKPAVETPKNKDEMEKLVQ